MRSRADLKPETKRASVSDVAPRGSITSTSENCPRRLTARSSAAASPRRVVTRSPTPPIRLAMSAKCQSSRSLKRDSGWNTKAHTGIVAGRRECCVVDLHGGEQAVADVRCHRHLAMTVEQVVDRG